MCSDDFYVIGIYGSFFFYCHNCTNLTTSNIYKRHANKKEERRGDFGWYLQFLKDWEGDLAGKGRTNSNLFQSPNCKEGCEE